MSEALHIMIITTRHGSSLAHCPVCGRRVLIRWQHAWRSVLAAGDPHATHTGGR